MFSCHGRQRRRGCTIGHRPIRDGPRPVPTVTLQALTRTVEGFLSEAGGAVVLENGAVAFDLAQSKYSISGEYNRCLLHLWSAERNAVRRVLDAEIKDGTLRLVVRGMAPCPERISSLWMFRRPRALNPKAAVLSGSAGAARAPSTDTLLRYLFPDVEWEFVGIDERWREGVKVVFRKRPEGRGQHGGTENAGFSTANCHLVVPHPFHAPSIRRRSTNWPR